MGLPELGLWLGRPGAAPQLKRRPWLEHWLETCRDLSELRGVAPDDGRGHRRDRRPHDPGRRPAGSRTSPPATTSASTSTARSSTRSPPTSTRGARIRAGRGCSAARCSTSEIEERLTELLGCEDSLVLPTITHIHMSVIPLLAASGTIFLDARAHKTIYDGCQVARARGAAVRRFRFEDPDHLDELLVAGARPHAARLHGRRQQHDRQRARTCARSPRSRAATARCSTSTTRTASA